MKKLSLCLLTLFLLSMSSDLQKKILRQDGFDIECYVYAKPLKAFEDHFTYYWFKSGEIITTKGGANGFVLHKEYAKRYRSKQLAEKGSFRFGLKNGLWKHWYESGQEKTFVNWRTGEKHGEYMEFAENGTLVVSGQYIRNQKAGRWIQHLKKDTTYYAGDSVYKVKPEPFLKRLFKKKDSLEKREIKLKRQQKRRQDSITRAKRKLENAKKEEGFFKRLFKSKKKN